MSIFKNAIASIQIGIEDFGSGDERRLLSAVRNVYAGILLLGKEILLSISPRQIGDVLIRDRIVPRRNDDGSISFIGKSDKTIDRMGLVERFRQIGIDIDEKRLKRIGAIRNDIEHYYCDKPAGAVREAISESFMIIRDMLAVHLNIEPSEALGLNCWNVLLKNHEITKKEEDECRKALAAIEWKSPSLADSLDEFRCQSCGSSLVKQEHRTETGCRAGGLTHGNV